MDTEKQAVDPADLALSRRFSLLLVSTEFLKMKALQMLPTLTCNRNTYYFTLLTTQVCPVNCTNMCVEGGKIHKNAIDYLGDVIHTLPIVINIA